LVLDGVPDGGSGVGQAAQQPTLFTSGIVLVGDCLRVTSVGGDSHTLSVDFVSAEKIDCPMRAEAEMVPRWRDCMPNESSTNGRCFDMIPALKSEPREIPATMEKRETGADSNWCNKRDAYSCTAMACVPRKVTIEVPTCPSQGSWIQENSTDGKHWCRKIQ
jgi:hypothetical protein